MARNDPHFRLRVPTELKAQIEAAAKASNRSLNAEVVTRLHYTFSPVGPEPITIDELENPANRKRPYAALRPRLSEEMVQRLREAAKANSQSITQELNSRLEASFGLVLATGLDALPPSLMRRIESRAAETQREVREEIILALEKAFPPPAKTFGDYMEDLRATLESGQVHPTLEGVFNGLLRSYEMQAKRDPSWLKKRPEYQAQPGSWPVNFEPADDNDETD